MLSVADLKRLMGETLRNPREGAATVLSMAPPREALWLMMVLVVVVSTLIGTLLDGFMPPPPPDQPVIELSPIVSATIQLVFIMGTVWAVYGIGRMCGGTGSFDETLLLVVWMSAVLIPVQLGLVLVMLILPALGGLAIMFATGVFFYLLTQFITVLHGFRSAGLTFVMIISSMLVLAFIASFVLLSLGIVVAPVEGM